MMTVKKSAKEGTNSKKEKKTNSLRKVSKVDKIVITLCTVLLQWPYSVHNSRIWLTVHKPCVRTHHCLALWSLQKIATRQSQACVENTSLICQFKLFQLYDSGCHAKLMKVCFQYTATNANLFGDGLHPTSYQGGHFILTPRDDFPTCCAGPSSH